MCKYENVLFILSIYLGKYLIVVERIVWHASYARDEGFRPAVLLRIVPLE